MSAQVSCVAVGEGFGNDVSTSPGARIYVTTDGETFTLAYQAPGAAPSADPAVPSLLAAQMLLQRRDACTTAWALQGEDGSSLMAAKMLSKTEHWAGGMSKQSFAAPLLALHSTDGGGSYTNEHGGVVGQCITAMDFVAGVGYATTVNALQVSSLLKYY